MAGIWYWKISRVVMVITSDILNLYHEWPQNFGSKDLYVPSLLVTNNSHGKTKIIAILTIPMGKPMIIVLFTIPMEKTNSRNFLLAKVFWLILVLNMDTYISTYMIYKLTEWIIMIHGNWKDHNYFRFFHGNFKHYNDHVLSHGNCKNHNDLGFSMGIVGMFCGLQLPWEKPK